MVELYVSRGMREEDAVSVINTIAQYHQLFVDVMMVEELGLVEPREGDSAPRTAGMRALGFALGCLPTCVALIAASSAERISCASIGTACALTARAG